MSIIIFSGIGLFVQLNYRWVKFSTKLIRSDLELVYFSYSLSYRVGAAMAVSESDPDCTDLPIHNKNYANTFSDSPWNGTSHHYG